ncbi:MAG: MotA/TolQ/ExbB proton channel family protein [Paludibacteraceae bacterium]|nr:MotA/TolQ/ExbB proton channel family protein [Paludibacteraceae bacterium]MBP5642019.1 MotA/TolQ/ExbB proton channel family protein [Paludibacteraceae bacterium]
MLFQIDTIDAMAQELAVVEEPIQQSINLWTMAQYGGWIMIILALMLLWAVYIFAERMLTIKAATKEDKSFMDRIRDYIHEGKIDSALNLCRQTNTPSARMIEKGITRIGRPMQDVQVAVENVGNLEIGNLEKNLVIMATIAGGAPMLGFLGTVLGMVQTFFNMAQNASGVIEMAALSEGMYQAMVTTIGGLIVGILAMFAYNFLVARIDRVVRRLEGRTLEFMDLLNEPA